MQVYHDITELVGHTPVVELAKSMEAIGGDMGLSIRVQREDIFQSMHRI